MVPVDLVVCFRSQRKVTFPVLRVVAGAARWRAGVAMAMGAAWAPTSGALERKSWPFVQGQWGPSAAVGLLTVIAFKGKPRAGGASFPGMLMLRSLTFKKSRIYFTPEDRSFYGFSLTGQR